MFDTKTEILGLGLVTVDDLLTVDEFPTPNAKQGIVSSLRQCGGLTGSALVAAARMGCRCGYAVTLGENELSNHVRRELGREGISLLERAQAPDAEPYHAIVIIEEKSGERSVLWDRSKTRPPLIGKMELALAARVGCLFVDHAFAPALLEIARAARRAGTPIVGDFERSVPDSLELMDLTDHLIIPLGYARKLLSEKVTPEKAAETLARRPGRALACVTDSERGAWYALGDRADRVLHQPAFPIDGVVDTTGCGDVFHGVYAAGVVKGWTPRERIRRASAAAALKTLKRGAQAGAPTLAQLDAFLDDAGDIA